MANVKEKQTEDFFFSATESAENENNMNELLKMNDDKTVGVEIPHVVWNASNFYKPWCNLFGCKRNCWYWQW